MSYSYYLETCDSRVGYTDYMDGYTIDANGDAVSIASLTSSESSSKTSPILKKPTLQSKQSSQQTKNKNGKMSVKVRSWLKYRKGMF